MVNNVSFDSASSASGDRQSVRSLETKSHEQWCGRYNANHVPCGSGCKFCRRKDTFPNPLPAPSGKVAQPTLPWRRAQGRVCSICPWAIEVDETGKWKGKDTDTLEEELKDDNVHKDYMETCIDIYEKKKREGGGKRVASTGAKANAGVQVVRTRTWSTRNALEFCGQVTCANRALASHGAAGRRRHTSSRGGK